MREASSLMQSPPKMMLVAPRTNTTTPSGTLPPVATKMLSLLKKIPEPMQMPTIMEMVVNRP